MLVVFDCFGHGDEPLSVELPARCMTGGLWPWLAPHAFGTLPPLHDPVIALPPALEKCR